MYTLYLYLLNGLHLQRWYIYIWMLSRCIGIFRSRWSILWHHIFIIRCHSNGNSTWCRNIIMWLQHCIRYAVLMSVKSKKEEKCQAGNLEFGFEGVQVMDIDVDFCMHFKCVSIMWNETIKMKLFHVKCIWIWGI